MSVQQSKGLDSKAAELYGQVELMSDYDSEFMESVIKRLYVELPLTDKQEAYLEKLYEKYCC